MSQSFNVPSSADETRRDGRADIYSGLERRSHDPINQLGRQLNEICISAVDPLQIAAALEAEGWSDAAIATRFHLPSVFELAEILFQRVPLRIEHLPSVPSQRRKSWRELSHGLLFALPGLFYPPAVSLAPAASTTLALALAVIAGWAWSQLMVRLAYLLIGRSAHKEAAQLLRITAAVGIAGVAVAGSVVSWLYPSAAPAALLASGQMSYHMAAAILLMYERETWLLLALLPGVAASLLFLGAPFLMSAPLATWVSVMSLGLALAAAWRITSEATGHLPRWCGVTRRDLWDALPFLAYGTLCAFFVSFDTLRFWTWIGATGLGLTIAPLVLSMGVLEWQLRRFREQVALLLARTNNSRTFDNGVWSLFLGVLTRFALILAGLSLASWPLLAALSGDGSRAALLLSANWVLGCAFFIGFALISQNRLGLVMTFLTLALSVHALDVSVVLPSSLIPAHDYTSSYLLGCLIFCISLMAISRPVLVEIRSYRYDLEASHYGRPQR